VPLRNFRRQWSYPGGQKVNLPEQFGAWMVLIRHFEEHTRHNRILLLAAVDRSKNDSRNSFEQYQRVHPERSDEHQFGFWQS
jgi:hypothetical protein